MAPLPVTPLPTSCWQLQPRVTHLARVTHQPARYPLPNHCDGILLTPPWEERESAVLAEEQETAGEVVKDACGGGRQTKQSRNLWASQSNHSCHYLLEYWLDAHSVRYKSACLCWERWRVLDEPFCRIKGQRSRTGGWVYQSMHQSKLAKCENAIRVSVLALSRCLAGVFHTWGGALLKRLHFTFSRQQLQNSHLKSG